MSVLELAPPATVQPALPGLELTDVGARRTGDSIDVAAVVDALRGARRHEAAWNFQLGDLVLVVEQEMARGEALVAVDSAGLDRPALARVRAVAEKVPYDRRRPELTWSHHVEVAHLDDRAQTRLLATAVDEGLSVRALRSLIAQEAADLAPALDLPEATRLPSPPATRLRAIYADVGDGGGMVWLFAGDTAPIRPDEVPVVLDFLDRLRQRRTA